MAAHKTPRVQTELIYRLFWAMSRRKKVSVRSGFDGGFAGQPVAGQTKARLPGSGDRESRALI
jgi:hypothetical protein